MRASISYNQRSPPDKITIDPSDRRFSHLYLESKSLYLKTLKKGISGKKGKKNGESMVAINAKPPMLPKLF